ncbi:MAG TPA: lysophospholipid acyltransferase family protein [Solirubrobacteraceae bacterium]|jgi:1-acyl-sn-glycerol-3-phosphate acyltransferase|nr:lysophospholipid acyltransferase family protein [Solirubrobacteraceae bacterium]
MADDAKIKAQVYKDPRPSETFNVFHERVRDHGPEWIYEVVRVLTTLNALILFRARGFGSELVPEGPVIMAPNHASFMDHFFCGAFVRRHIQFMAKSQMFGRGPLSWVYTHGGVFPVRRGHHDEEAFVSAFKILERGGVVGMYVEGGRSRTGTVGTEAKPGVGRLALESGAPVVPVAILGSHQVRNWKRGRFPQVVVQYGAPIVFEPVESSTREQQQRAADEILARIQAMHAEMTELGAKPARRRLAERARERQLRIEMGQPPPPAGNAPAAAPPSDRVYVKP